MKTTTTCSILTKTSDTKLKPSQKKALNKIADHLARRDHSEKELQQKLQGHFAPDDIEWAIDEARVRNWLCPADELAQKVARQHHNKKKGILFINRYLEHKGLPTVSKVDAIELEKAQDLLQVKLKKTENLSYEERQKAYKFLSYRGFDSETINKVIHES